MKISVFFSVPAGEIRGSIKSLQSSLGNTAVTPNQKAALIGWNQVKAWNAGRVYGCQLIAIGTWGYSIRAYNDKKGGSSECYSSLSVRHLGLIPALKNS